MLAPSRYGNRNHIDDHGGKDDGAKSVVAAEAIEAILGVVNVKRGNLPDQVSGRDGQAREKPSASPNDPP